MDSPLVLEGDGVDNPNNDREEDTGGALKPVQVLEHGHVRSGEHKIPMGPVRVSVVVAFVTYQRAVPRKAMAEPTYMGSLRTLKGKPVTRADMRIPQ